MAHLYLDEDLDGAAAGDVIALCGAEARHAARVARLRVGERTMVGNGRGLTASTLACAVSDDRVELAVETAHFTPPHRPRIELAQALAKGGRDELAIQAATELGADALIPWQANRSVPRWQAGKADRGRGRWQSIAREAAKQSLRPWLPEVRPMCDTTALAETAAARALLILVPGADTALTDAVVPGRDILLAVGPEGGIDEGEVALLADAGGIPVHLGTGILRTSTAGPAAIAALCSALGRW